MEKDELDEGEQVEKATLFVRKYNEVWKNTKSSIPAALDNETILGNTQLKSASPLTNQEKQTVVAMDETQAPMDTTSNEIMATPAEDPSAQKLSEHTYSKCPSSTGPIMRKPVVRTRVFPTAPIVNNGIILTSWGVNNRYLEQATVETPISAPSPTIDTMKQRNKKSVTKELEDQFFKDLGPLPPPSPEPDLTLCPLTGELLAPAEETEPQVEIEEMVDGSTLDEEQDNMSLPSMPMLLEDALSFNE